MILIIKKGRLKMKHLGRTKKSAFTLIELLVVIAIIAILAAILFPVFAQAREKARAITCISNEKQMGLGIVQYVQDYDEHFGFANIIYNGPSGLQESRWYNQIAPYIKNGNTIAAGSVNAGTYDGSGGIWHCPDFPSQQNANYGVNDHLWPQVAFGTTQVANSLNTAVLNTPASTIVVLEKGQSQAGLPAPNGSSWPWFAAFEGWWTDKTCSTDPCYSTAADVPGTFSSGNDYSVTTTWFPADCDDTPSGTISMSNIAWGSCGLHPRYRHNGTTNALFCDGHVKAFQRGKISWANNIYDQAAWENYNAGFNGSGNNASPADYPPS